MMNGEHEHFVLGTARGWTASMMVVTGEAEDAGDGALLAKGEAGQTSVSNAVTVTFGSGGGRNGSGDFGRESV
jgi:hypothetical protein